MRRTIGIALCSFVVAMAALAGVVNAQRRPQARARRGRSAPSARVEAPASTPAHSSITDDLPCSACHTPEGWRIQGAGGGEGGFDHARTGFPLSGRHRQVGCTECHAPRRQVRRDCVSCHQDQHQGRLGQRCVRCHSSVSWTDTRAIEIHRLTRLPLTGMHAIAACADCHRRTEDRAYSAIPAECISCHDAEYRRPDVHPNHLGSPTSAPFPRDCSQCHRATAWSPAFVVDPTMLGSSSAPLTQAAGPRHELRFPISRGSHMGAACESCHEDLRTPSAIRCTGCHVHNPIRVMTQHTTVRPGTDGRGCLGCHPGGMVR